MNKASLFFLRWPPACPYTRPGVAFNVTSASDTSNDSVTSISTPAWRMHRSFKSVKQTPSLIGGVRVTKLSGGLEMFSFAER